jgi:radical SAM superfamily enzyme YgiQ (UPF0313 family)
MARLRKRILLVNPWIYDFAAYDLWSRPLGLLTLGGRLRNRGYGVFLIDCLDVYSPWMTTEEAHRPPRTPYHCGKFFKQSVEKPLPLQSIPRTYSRYGISDVAFWKALHEIGRPDLVLVTSLMTYWYPGPFRVIEIVKEVFPGVPVILGGIYATLCEEHAVANSQADHVFVGGEIDRAVALVDEILGIHSETVQQVSHPVFDLYPHVDAVCMETSRGCPYRCVYCASCFLEDRFDQRSPDDVVEEITYWARRFRVTDVAFYDDALLVNGAHHMVPILEELVKHDVPCRFHVPNGIHARDLTRQIAELMVHAGFKTIRLGLETINPVRQVETGGKVGDEDVQRAIEFLREAGFSSREIGVYLMVGLPGQPKNEVEEGIEKVWEWGALPKIAEYSPIPHTALWEEAVQQSSYDLEGEPLFQNNSILPCAWEGFSWDDLMGIKRRLQNRIRDSLSGT